MRRVEGTADVRVEERALCSFGGRYLAIDIAGEGKRAATPWVATVLSCALYC
jgi:hypothetical protein